MKLGFGSRWTQADAPSPPTAVRKAAAHTLPAAGLVHYRLGWKPGGYQAGLVSGSTAGMGDTLRSVVPWLEYPDPRRLDIRATLRDPFAQLWVRDFKRNTAISVIALVDASASMAYHGVYQRPAVVMRMLQVLAQSAYAAGDAFGMYVAGSVIEKGLSLPPKIHRSAPLWIARHWPRFQPQGQRAHALLDTVALLPKRKSLVCVISDFHWPEGQLASLLKSLSHHDVVPLVLQDPAECRQLPPRGFAQLADMEQGKAAFVWLNAQTRDWLRQRAEAHLAELTTVCQHYGVRPHVVSDDFQPQALTAYFLRRQ